jgi:hypothetical protein
VRTLYKNPELDGRWRQCEGLRRAPAIDNLASFAEKDQLEETDKTMMLARSVDMVGTEKKREEEGQAEEGSHCCWWSRRVISWSVLLCRLRYGSSMKVCIYSRTASTKALVPPPFLRSECGASVIEEGRQQHGRLVDEENHGGRRDRGDQSGRCVSNLVRRPGRGLRISSAGSLDDVF